MIRVVNALKLSFPVKVILEVFNIPKSTYYRWKRKNYEVDSVEEKTKYICHKHNYTYGYRKVTAELNKHSVKKVNHKKNPQTVVVKGFFMKFDVILLVQPHHRILC